MPVATTSRSAAHRSLVLAGVIISARVANADSINLLRSTSTTAPLILFDQSAGPWPSDDEATALIARECVALSDRTRDRRFALGGVNWRAGRLAWQWEPRKEPDIVYVICVERPQRQPGFAAGLQMAAALSWSGRPIANVSRGQPAANGGPVRAGVEPTPVVPGETPESWTDPPLDMPPDAPREVPLGLPIPIGAISFPAAPTSDTFPGGGTTVSPPFVLDPPGMIPTPEPGTFVLMGTGLAAAWRIARRKREG